MHFLSLTLSCWFLVAYLYSTWNSVLDNSTGTCCFKDKHKLHNLCKMIKRKKQMKVFHLFIKTFTRCGCLSLWEKICPMLKGIGYAICIIDIYVGMFYNTVIGWAVYYFVQAFLSAAQVQIFYRMGRTLWLQLLISVYIFWSSKFSALDILWQSLELKLKLCHSVRCSGKRKFPYYCWVNFVNLRVATNPTCRAQQRNTTCEGCWRCRNPRASLSWGPSSRPSPCPPWQCLSLCTLPCGRGLSQLERW